MERREVRTRGDAQLAARKRRHIDVCLTDDVNYTNVTTGLERYRLDYNAVTQTSIESIDLSTRFFGHQLRAPVLIGAMTGGADLAGTINRNLATAAQQLGLGMMLGSQRIMLRGVRGATAAHSFAVREHAPDILLFGNIGVSQLRSSNHTDIAAAIDQVGANALAVHTNPLQEAMQFGGNSDFSGSVQRIRDAAAELDFPILLKEVGHGIGRTAVRNLTGDAASIPVAGIDVAGAGGTSWARVEQLVRYGHVRHPDIAEWGIPTARALIEVRAELSDIPLVASGGIRTGMDAAKAIALGADVVAIARPLLAPAIESAQAVTDWLEGFLAELRVCLHGCGATDLAALRRTALTTAEI